MIVAVLSSCDDDFFATTVNVDPPEFQDLLVVNLVGTNLSNSLDCRISNTYRALEDKSSSETLLNEAIVKLKTSGSSDVEFVNDLSRSPEFNYRGFLIDSLVPGQSYELQVEHPDYDVVTATQVMPELVEVREMELVEQGGIDIDGEELATLEFKINDPSGIQNFYGCQILVVDTASQYYDVVPIYTNDLQIVDGFNYSDVYLTDQAFEGKTYTIRLEFSRGRYAQVRQFGYLLWKNVSKDFYQYTTSLARFENGDDFEGFSEPTIIHSNIEGGLGCFGLVNASLLALPR